MRNVLTLVLGLSAALATAAPGFAADADAGKKVFNKCKACHAVGEGAKNKVGPLLNGIVGAEIASNPDFKYSNAFLEKKEEGLVWDAANLDEYLTKPKAFIKGTKMSFAGLKKEDDRANVIAYLETFPAE